MDGETIRLIVVACGAIIAGLGGALIAGAFNSGNTQATIEAARAAAAEQREADRELEHAQWLRDRKIDVYMAYIRKLHSVEIAIAAMKDGIENPGIASITAAVKELFDMSLTMRILAPDNVANTAREVTQILRKIVVAAPDALQLAPEPYEPYETAVVNFRETMVLLELQVAADLGVRAVRD
ncbi:hypothetical protein [Arthrobacter burdickii]|uniref:Uncharacterized protein n=1 Tax=Arthrobacter burdickii TaxID=3035920 RepID=A0ABT8K206_9MICC|nr:hypothetical protein [Arthrobacter burdickii]MDN4611460.1 hypothetical protein [Arthrobacter burdickii]